MKTILIVTMIVFFTNGVRTEMMSPFPKGYPLHPTGPVPDDSEAVLTNFTQKLDHFDDSDTTTWKQRYYVSKEFFNKTANNVAFLMIGGETEITVEFMHYGNWITSAKNYGAIIFQLEHRFYGKSHPFNDLTLEHLQYLTSKQALADAANFIQLMNKEHALASDVKWIIFGGSYAGALATWMRLKYKDLVSAAVASSPTLTAKLDFKEYFKVVARDLTITKKGCKDILREAMSQVESYMFQSETPPMTQTRLNECPPVRGRVSSDDPDVQTFYNVLAHQISNITQYNNQERRITLADVCDILTNAESGREIDQLNEVLIRLRGSECLPVDFNANLEFYKKTDILNDIRPWMFQTCNEFGWFQRSDDVHGLFGRGVSLDYLVDLCTETFGREYTLKNISDKVDATNREYFGERIYFKVSNVAYVYGSFDPWYRIGEPLLLPDGAVLIYVVRGASHCADMADISDRDSPELAQAKKKVDRLVGGWLGFDEEK